MTNQQRAALETAKFFAIVVIISTTVGLAVMTGYAPWLGIAACVTILAYGLIMIYEMKLSQIEAEERRKENV